MAVSSGKDVEQLGDDEDRAYTDNGSQEQATQVYLRWSIRRHSVPLDSYYAIVEECLTR